MRITLAKQILLGLYLYSIGYAVCTSTATYHNSEIVSKIARHTAVHMISLYCRQSESDDRYLTDRMRK